MQPEPVALKRRFNWRVIARVVVPLVVFLAIGAGVWFLDFKRPVLPLPPVPALRITPRRTPFEPVIGDPRFTKAIITSVNFSAGLAPFKIAEYKSGDEFRQGEIYYVCEGIGLKYPNKDGQVEFPINLTTYKSNGSILAEDTLDITLVPNSNGWVSYVCKAPVAGDLWEVGLYRVEFKADGILIGTGSFEITD